MKSSSERSAHEISQRAVASLRLKGKPRCPYCGKPLGFVYDDAEAGHLNQKCPTCGRHAIVDIKTMSVFRIVEGERADGDETICEAALDEEYIDERASG